MERARTRSVALGACLGWLAALLLGEPAAADPGSAGVVDAAACSPDEALSEAAAELLLAGRFKPTAEELIAAVRAAGSDGVGLHALYMPAETSEAAARSAYGGWLSEQRQRADAALLCGHAASEHGQLWITSASGGTLRPISAGEHIVVRGALSPGFERAELVVSAQDGQLARYGVSAAQLAKGVELDPEEASGLCREACTVQLVARGSSGPRPVAERWVRAAASTHAVGGAEDTSAARAPAAERRDLGLTALIAELRAARGRPKLRVNSLLSQAASAHAKAVCERGQVAHEVEAGQGPEARLERVGLSARVLGEAIARADDAPAAFAALQRSPSHLFTLLDARFTDFAVGVADDRAGKRCYVVMLCAWPRAIGQGAP